ncbi:ABC transporter substrate-binding protein [Microbacterium sp.]|uniref:ABC transporter substrate-binding protein n=1 Tax=Microbacterium sp. TaxID=51671 RepID=UPI003F954BBB
MTLRTRSRMLPALAGAAALTLTLAACQGGQSDGGDGGGDASDEIVIGVLAVDSGNLSFAMGEAERAIQAVLDENGDEIGGKELRLIYEGTDGTTGSAQDAVRKLVENDGVDIVLGPASGDEGETVVQYALTAPEVTFVNGAASPVGMTLEGAENFFRFMGDSAMWMGGLGEYAYTEKGYESMYILSEDYSFPYDNAGGFFDEFCAAGGELVGASWVPVGTQDYATIIAQIPSEVDAIYVGLGGADAASFLAQAVSNGLDKPIVGGSITVDQTALSGDANIKDAAIGTITGGPVPGVGYDNPEWTTFTETVENPNIFTLLYYQAFDAMYQALAEVDGDLSDDQAAFRDAMQNISYEGPAGPMTLDENRQAIVDNFLTEVVEGPDGSLITEQISQKSDVAQGTTVYDRFESCP